MRWLFSIVLLLGFHSPAFAKDLENPKVYEKNIFKGNYEFDVSFSPSSAGLGLDLSLRYFFWDKISLGLTHSFYDGELSKLRSYGISGRWYFAEVGNWAFSVTQNITYNQVEYSALAFPDYSYWSGETRLGAHYFINPNAAIGVTVGYDYNLSRGWSGFNQNLAAPNVGIGFGFNF